MTLAPGKDIAFDYDVGARWPELFAPGSVRVRIIDQNEEAWRTQSNELTWRIVFKPESVELLLALLGDAQSTLDAKSFAVKCLNALNADFHFEIERSDAAAKHSNQIAIENYRSWWAANRGSDGVAQQLASLNRAP